jgi:hypothetical protein
MWAHLYRKAARIQAPLTLIGCATSLGVWKLSPRTSQASNWLISGLLIGFSVPFTLLVIAPNVNNPLLALDNKVQNKSGNIVLYMHMLILKIFPKKMRTLSISH